MHRQVDSIQIGTQNIGLYKEVDKKYTGCNLKSTELLDCALIWVCAITWLNTVYIKIKRFFGFTSLTKTFHYTSQYMKYVVDSKKIEFVPKVDAFSGGIETKTV